LKWPKISPFLERMWFPKICWIEFIDTRAVCDVAPSCWNQKLSFEETLLVYRPKKYWSYGHNDSNEQLMPIYFRSHENTGKWLHNMKLYIIQLLDRYIKVVDGVVEDFLQTNNYNFAYSQNFQDENVLHQTSKYFEYIFRSHPSRLAFLDKKCCAAIKVCKF